MKNEDTLRKYVESFIRQLAKYIRGNLVVSSEVYPSEGEGAVIEFNINENDTRVTFHHPLSSINEILKKVPQRLVGGNIEGIKFSGTNISIDGQRIVLIKGENGKEFWDRRAVDRDISRVIDPRGAAES